MTPAALAAKRANLVKANAVLKELGCVITGKRQAASRANLAKGRAARKRAGYASVRMNGLKDGLFAEDIVASGEILGEDLREYEEHRRQFERVFVPEDDIEKKLVRRLADTVWRRLRFYRAILRWEKAELEEIFTRAGAGERLTAEETEQRAIELAALLGTYEQAFDRAALLQRKMATVLRALLGKRSEGKIKFKIPRRVSPLPEFKEDPMLKVMDRLLLLQQTAEGREALRKIREKAGIRDWGDKNRG